MKFIKIDSLKRKLRELKFQFEYYETFGIWLLWGGPDLDYQGMREFNSSKNLYLYLRIIEKKYNDR